MIARLLSLLALGASIHASPVLLHYWSFNDESLDPAYTLGGAELSIDAAAQTEILFATGQDFAGLNNRLLEETGFHLRVNNPLGTVVYLDVPTTGYSSIIVQYESRRSGQGAGIQQLSYTTDGNAYVNWPTAVVLENEAPLLYTFDFTSVAAANNNPDFGLRIQFTQGDGGTEGNNRFDNITVEGTALPGVNQPPVVENIPDTAELSVGGGTLSIDVSSVFSDPDDDDLTLSAISLNPTVATVSVSGSTLQISGVQAGQAEIELSANDGNNPSVSTRFVALVYPAPHAISAGAYTFNQWSSVEPAGSFPPHMLFLQSEVDDPDLEAELTRAYHIPEWDAAEAADALFPYNATSRSRIQGLGARGIAFINTGRGRDLGSALLALDTTGQSDIYVTWTGGTELANNRVYSLRLEYRLGLEGDWNPVTDGDAVPVEYMRASDGHSTVIGPVRLPVTAENRSDLQLQWRYYYVSGDSGPRAMLRLDDITVQVGSETPTPLPTPEPEPDPNPVPDAYYVFGPSGNEFIENFGLYRGTYATLPQYLYVSWDGSRVINPFTGVSDYTTGDPETGYGALSAYTADNSSYSFGIRERAPIDLRDARLYFAFVNETGQAIERFNVSYDVEAWYRGDRANRIRLKYDTVIESETRSVFETDIFSTPNPAASALPGAKLNGSLPENRVSVSGVVDVASLEIDASDETVGTFGALPNGATAYFRWQFSNLAEGESGERRSGLAITNIRIEPVIDGAGDPIGWLEKPNLGWIYNYGGWAYWAGDFSSQGWGYLYIGNMLADGSGWGYHYPHGWLYFLPGGDIQSMLFAYSLEQNHWIAASTSFGNWFYSYATGEYYSWNQPLP